jgi:hypothetical protein
MADNSEKRENPVAKEQDRVITDRVQELTWALLDEQVNADEFRLLENLLLSDDKARDTYIGCVQLHADLLAHFAAPSTEETANVRSGPVVGFLNPDLPALGFQSPSAEDVRP